MPMAKKPLPLYQRLSPLIVDSPYQPEIPDRMVWTSSSIKLFRKCRRKWFWKYILRLGTRYTGKDLMIGSAFHHAIGEWYYGKRSSMEIIAGKYQQQLKEKASVEMQAYDQDDWDKLDTYIENFVGMMMGYDEMYRDDRKVWRYTHADIEIPFKVDCGDFDFAGKVDLLPTIPDRKCVVVVEHKTSSRLRTAYIDRLPLDTQVRGYTFGAIKGVCAKPREVLYDVVVKSKYRRKGGESQAQFTQRIRNAYMAEPNRFYYREYLTFSKADIDAFEFELHQTHNEYKHLIKHEWADPSYLQGVGITTPTDALDPRNWPPNDGTCDEYFRNCPFIPLCTRGLDPGTATLYQQGDKLNPELDNGEEADD